MKIGYGLAMLLVAGASLLPVSSTLANVQSVQEIGSASSLPVIAEQFGVSHFRIVQTPTGKGCPKGTRYDVRSAQCVKTGG